MSSAQPRNNNDNKIGDMVCFDVKSVVSLILFRNGKYAAKMSKQIFEF